MKPILRKSVIRSIIVKEFRHLLRDRRVRGVLFGSPILMLLLFGYAVNTDVKNIRMAVFDDDRTSLSRDLTERFTASGYFIPVAHVPAGRDLVRLMDSGALDMFIHIERGFKKKLQTGQESNLQVIIDGMDSSRASVIISYVNEIITSYSQGIFNDRIRVQMMQRTFSGGDGEIDPAAPQRGARIKKTIGIRERFFFNPDLRSRNFFLPGVLGLVIALVMVMLTSMSIVKERETGTIEQIIVSPVRSYEFILGKTIPFIIIGFFDLIIISSITILWFNVPFNGNFLFLLGTGLLYTLSTLAQGLYISTVSKTQQQAMVSTFLVLLPSIMLSGFVFPIDSMPLPVQLATYLNPLRYYIAILRGVFLKGVGVAALWREIIPLAVIGVTILILSARRFARRLE